MALAVGADIMGLGLVLASGDSCFLGMLGGCNELGSQNRNAILSTVHYVNEMNARLKEAAGTIDNKFFVLGEEINDMKTTTTRYYNCSKRKFLNYPWADVGN